jgi:hypothetical protein
MPATRRLNLSGWHEPRPVEKPAALRFFAIVLMVISAPISTSPAAGQTVFRSEHRAATLIELFTSEGCSSCAAADAWMSQFKNSAELWKTVVPVVFHVDYWGRTRLAGSICQAEFHASAAELRCVMAD